MPRKRKDKSRKKIKNKDDEFELEVVLLHIGGAVHIILQPLADTSTGLRLSRRRVNVFETRQGSYNNVNILCFLLMNTQYATSSACSSILKPLWGVLLIPARVPVMRVCVVRWLTLCYFLELLTDFIADDEERPSTRRTGPLYWSQELPLN